MTVKQLIVQLEELDVGEDATVKVYGRDLYDALVPIGDVEVHDMSFGEKVPEFVVIW